VHLFAQDFPFLVQAAAFHQRLVHHHVFAAVVLDEEHHVGKTVEQRLAGEGFGELRKQLVLQVGGRHLCRNPSGHWPNPQDEPRRPGLNCGQRL